MPVNVAHALIGSMLIILAPNAANARVAARHHHHHAPAPLPTPTRLCPYGVSGDGCTPGQLDPGGGVIQGPPAANANSVQHPDFFSSYSRQSGQAAYAVRPPWNVAGVDYPVGIGSTTYSGSLVPAVDASGHSNIPHCIGPGDQGGAAGQMNCTVDQGSAGLTINGFGFSNSGHCLSLYISHQSGPIMITNNKISTNSYVAPDCGYAYYLVNIDSDNKGNADINYNILDGGASTGTWDRPIVLLQTGAAGDIRIEYNACIGIIVRCWSAVGMNSASLYFNYFEGIYGTGSEHGDITFPTLLPAQYGRITTLECRRGCPLGLAAAASSASRTVRLGAPTPAYMM